MHADDARLQRRRHEHTVSLSQLLPRPGPRLYTGVAWWAFGLYALFLARAPYTPSVEAEQQYNDLMQAAVFSPEAQEAQFELEDAQRKLDKVHVFGWRWREPYSKLVPPRQRVVDEARRRLQAAIRERNELQSEAKSKVGIWSQYGVDEVRERFWQAYQNGKDFAKRMTFWDVIFGIGGGRDEELYVTLLRWLGQIMLNFTIGLVSALFSFAFSLVCARRARAARRPPPSPPASPPERSARRPQRCCGSTRSPSSPAQSSSESPCRPPPRWSSPSSAPCTASPSAASTRSLSRLGTRGSRAAAPLASSRCGTSSTRSSGRRTTTEPSGRRCLALAARYESHSDTGWDLACGWVWGGGGGVSGDYAARIDGFNIIYMS